MVYMLSEFMGIEDTLNMSENVKNIWRGYCRGVAVFPTS